MIILIYRNVEHEGVVIAATNVGFLTVLQPNCQRSVFIQLAKFSARK
jgi:hypothetical protein